MADSSRTIVVVGGGLAAAKAVETLREEGFDGRIELVADEPELPYERPPLSKDYLRGESERDAARVHDEAFYREHDVELRLGVAARELDLAASHVLLADGGELGFDRLLIATGAAPRRLPLPGAELDGVLVLRTLADADALRARLDGARRLAVIGAGWIGCEVSASARQLGCEVTLLERAALPLEAVLGPELGRMYRDLHAEHGVDLRMGSGVEAIEGDGRVEAVRVDGERVECDAVLVAVGVAPRTELAAAAGLEVGNGIVVDEHLRTGAPAVFAAGDVALVPHPLYGRRLRVEHWANALVQGPVAARAMLGKPAQHDAVPYFYSDQYDVGMEYAGDGGGADELVVRGDLAAREAIVFWLSGGRLVAGMNINIWDVNEDIQALIRSRAPVDRARLADADVPLAELAGSPASGG